MSARVMSECARWEPAHVEPYEIVEGQRRLTTPMSIDEALLASKLASSLANFAIRRRSGWVVMETLFQLNARSAFRPSVAFVRAGQSPPNNDPGVPTLLDRRPAIAIEVVGRTTSAEEIEIKTIEYFAAGVEAFWVLFPRQRRLHVYDSSVSMRVLTECDELDGGEVLPGFRLPLRTLFESQTDFQEPPTCRAS